MNEQQDKPADALTPADDRREAIAEQKRAGDKPAQEEAPPSPVPEHKRPRGVVGRILARERPGALPVPMGRHAAALTKPKVFEKWSSDAAGVRAVEKGDNVITMFDVIGEDFWSGGGITAKTVTAQLRAIGDRPVEVQINSPGGDMFEGLAIYNVLREHPQPVTIKVMGMAASAASIIAMAGDDIEIGVASFIMIHNCWVMAVGNRHDMLETAAFLEPFDQAMAGVYAARTGQSEQACAAWMKAETYMSGAVAIERGFADKVLPADKIVVDEKAQAADREVNKLRAMELKLMTTGESRTEARSHVNEIRGTTDSALRSAGTTDSAGDLSWLGQAASLTASLSQ